MPAGTLRERRTPKEETRNDDREHHREQHAKTQTRLRVRNSFRLGIAHRVRLDVCLMHTIRLRSRAMMPSMCHAHMPHGFGRPIPFVCKTWNSLRQFSKAATPHLNYNVLCMYLFIFVCLYV